MNRRIACFVLVASAVALCTLSRADIPDPFSEEPFSTFVDNLNAFSVQPTERALHDLQLACARLPVRDLKPGQIGTGHPLDRDAKLRCMLRFVAAMDRLTVDGLPVAYMNVAVEGVPIAGMNPGDVKDPVVREKYIAAIQANNAAIQVRNFQERLRQTRDVMVRLQIPRYFEYTCREMPAAHLQQIVTEELSGDVRAEAAVASLSHAAGAR